MIRNKAAKNRRENKRSCKLIDAGMHGRTAVGPKLVFFLVQFCNISHRERYTKFMSQRVREISAADRRVVKNYPSPSSRPSYGY